MPALPDQTLLGALHSPDQARKDHYIRDGLSDLRSIVADLGADARLQNALNLTYYNADAVHLTTAGYAAVGGILAGAIVAAVSPS